MIVVLIVLGALAYALAIRFVLRLCRAGADPPASWSPLAVRPSDEVLAEMRRRGAA